MYLLQRLLDRYFFIFVLAPFLYSNFEGKSWHWCSPYSYFEMNWSKVDVHQTKRGIEHTPAIKRASRTHPCATNHRHLCCLAFFYCWVLRPATSCFYLLFLLCCCSLCLFSCSSVSVGVLFFSSVELTFWRLPCASFVTYSDRVIISVVYFSVAQSNNRRQSAVCREHGRRLAAARISTECGHKNVRNTNPTK